MRRAAFERLRARSPRAVETLQRPAVRVLRMRQGVHATRQTWPPLPKTPGHIPVRVHRVRHDVRALDRLPSAHAPAPALVRPVPLSRFRCGSEEHTATRARKRMSRLRCAFLSRVQACRTPAQTHRRGPVCMRAVRERLCQARSQDRPRETALTRDESDLRNLSRLLRLRGDADATQEGPPRRRTCGRVDGVGGEFHVRHLSAPVQEKVRAAAAPAVAHRGASFPMSQLWTCFYHLVR